MNPDVQAQIEKLLSDTHNLSDREVNQRVKELEECFKKLFKDLPNFSLHDKAVFLKLLTRANELLRRAMDIQMKDLNLTPEKLKAIFVNASKSDSLESKGLMNALQYMYMQAEELNKAMARASVKLSAPATSAPQTQSAEAQRLKRSKWHKP